LEGNQTHLMCYFHLKARVKKKFSDKKVTKEDRPKILHCIDNLHSMINEKYFSHYYHLFKLHFSLYSEFLEYFEKEWVCSDSKTTKWRYFGCEPNVLMTNNICESLNASIKRDYTNREKKPLHQFIKTLKQIFIDLSLENKTIMTSLDISPKLKFAATQLEEKKVFLFRKFYYFLDRSYENKPSLDDVDNFLECKFDNLIEFLKEFEKISNFEVERRNKNMYLLL